MAASDDDYDARLEREVARLRSGQEQVAKLQETEDRYKREQEDAAQQAAANAGIAMNRAPSRQIFAAPRVRTKYEGPDPERASRGNFVSKEELADFQRKNPGATLRDLLNADRGLKRRGSSPLAGSGRGTAAGMGAADQVVLRPDPYADTSRVMEGVAAKQREMSRPGRDAIENVYPETVLIPATRLGPLAARAAQAIRGATASSGRPSEAERVASRIDPMLATGRVPETGRFRATEAPLSRARQQVREEMAAEPQLKRGGKVKAYAKGGSVKGAGCEQRGLRKCKVY